MRVELVNAFVLAAGGVLSTELNAQPQRGTLSLQHDAYVTNDVTVLVSLVGDVSGITIYSMDFDTAKTIISVMLDQETETFDELAQSGISELGNVISGQACTNLSNIGLEADISVPTLIVGKGSKISTLGIGRLTVPLETEVGVIKLDIALKEVQSKVEQAQSAAGTPLQMMPSA